MSTKRDLVPVLVNPSPQFDCEDDGRTDAQKMADDLAYDLKQRLGGVNRHTLDLPVIATLLVAIRDDLRNISERTR